MKELRTFDLVDPGLRCGECSERLLKVFRTKASEGWITRERICPKCGSLNTTTERVVSTRSRSIRMNEGCE